MLRRLLARRAAPAKPDKNEEEVVKTTPVVENEKNDEKSNNINDNKINNVKEENAKNDIFKKVNKCLKL